MKLMKRLLPLYLFFIVSIARADEGMWIPLLLEKLNEKEMKSLGLKISAKDIYNINNGSLKDAIVSFGGFCTGEIISSKGLVLTNHHCGFDAVQNHSTIEHNYIRDGFWAKSNAEELTNPGLFVTFIIRIEDVSKQVLAGLTTAMTEAERQSQVDKNIAEMKKTVKKESYQDSFIRGFFENNQYYLFITETYRDIRLVGAPPAAIGNFGKDTDNWMWPRHTGDFSMFRIYAGKDNKPADYSPNNVPYVPKKALNISLDGVTEGDFTMVFGFPGRTTEYLHSDAVEQIIKVNDPAKIAIRGRALHIIDEYMRKDERIKIQYAAKYANIENAYKKWQGEVMGLTATNALDKKRAYEAEFQKRVNGNAAWKEKYGTLLSDLSAAYADFKPYGYARDYFLEIASKIELLTMAGWTQSLKNATDKTFDDRKAQTLENFKSLYNEYNAEVDQQLFRSLFSMYLADLEVEYQSPLLRRLYTENGNDIGAAAEKIYGKTRLLDSKALFPALESASFENRDISKDDPAIELYNDLVKTYNEKVAKKLNEIQARINRLNRTYMQAQMEVFSEKKFYPDANSTLRLTYGKVKGFNPRDAVHYDYYTYLDGVMDKYKPGDYEFDVPQKLRALYTAKDFGVYGQNGRMPVCFIALNHTTGGNSGSPALDAYGNLVGLNFDRAWEGTMSDINYDPSICRNIMVDIRYVLFIIDKYAGASQLVAEMKLVHPKSRLK